MNNAIDIIVTDGYVDARLLYTKLEVKHNFRDWIKNIIRDYQFEDGKDFRYFFSESTGGRPKKEYALSIDVAKEVCMISKTNKSREVRKYFIEIEKEYRKKALAREIGKEVRKELTASIDESGENERMHGFGYSSYTKFAYKLCNIEYKKDKTFRDTLNTDQLKRVKIVEDMIKSLLEMGKQYKEIKDVLEPLFKDVKNKEKEVSKEK